MMKRFCLLTASLLAMAACDEQPVTSSSPQLMDPAIASAPAESVVPVRAKMGGTIVVTLPGLTVWLSDGRKCRAPELSDASWTNGVYPVNFTGICAGVTGTLTVTKASNEVMAAVFGVLEPEFTLSITMPDGKDYSL